MRTIFFLVPSLAGGGAEKFILGLSDHIDKSKFDITLIVIDKRGENASYQNNNIKIIDLKENKVKGATFKIIRLIKEEKPDLVFSTLGHLNILMSFISIFFPKIKFIGRETSIASLNKTNGLKNYLTNKIKFFLNRLDCVVAQSESMKVDLIDNFNIKKDKITVINNPVDFKKITQNKHTDETLFDRSKINLLAIGRLESVKGYERMLKSFALVKNIDEFRLSILGDGTLKNELMSLAIDLNINKFVKFLGFSNNPYKYIEQSDLLLITSYSEGFPNVVLEANACGKFVLGFNCPGGISEIITSSVNGRLIKDGDIRRFASSIEEFTKIKIEPIEIINTTEKFNLDIIINQYEMLFESLINNTGSKAI